MNTVKCTCTFYDLVDVGFKPGELLGHTESCLIKRVTPRGYWREHRAKLKTELASLKGGDV